LSWRREVASATTALALLGLSASPAASQVLRDPPTPYHFLRFDDVPSDQNSPHWPNDFWSPLKFIPLDIAPGSYINFGGEDRERVEYFNTPLFGLTPRRTTTYDLHRLLFQGDLHIDDTFRTFIQFSNHDVTSASLSPGTDVDQIDLQQGFADLKTSVGQDSSLTLRGGRQEMEFGVGRLIDVREGPNIRQSWDGGRAFYESPDLRLDAFVTKPVVPVPGFYPGGAYLGAHFDPGQDFWGLYGVMPVRAVPGLHVDLYYLGLNRRNVTYESDTANETAQTLGTRLWGGTGAWDYDTEGIFQFGAFGSRDVRAWSLASNTGYTLQGVWGQPRLGLQADTASGGGPSGPLNSFNPLFPKNAYFTEASINSPINFIDAFPSVTVQPTFNFAVTAGVDVLWRYSTLEAFYTPPGIPLVAGSANNKRFVGAQSNLHAEWQVTPHLNINAVYVHFQTEGFLKAAGGKNTDFVGAASLPFMEDEGLRLRLIAGAAWGLAAPVAVSSPLFYADAVLAPGAAVPLPNEHEERAAYVLDGNVEVAGERFVQGRMLVFRARDRLALRAGPQGARLLLLGGAAMDGPRYLFWNFVASSRERIEQAKADWKAGRFGKVPGDETEFIPLPEGM